MNIDLAKLKNLKIIPENYESATVFDIKQIFEDKFLIHMPKVTDNEIADYQKGAKVSAFGLSREGLVFFETDVIELDGKDLTLKMPLEFKDIQRRRYTRVPFMGTLEFKDIPEIKHREEDLSAGGIKFSADKPFNFDKEYDVKIKLINNLVVDCTIEPIRVAKQDSEDDLIYSVSARFSKIRSIDRIALMQYSLRLKTETENKA